MKYLLTLENYNTLVRYRYEDFLKMLNIRPLIIKKAVDIMKSIDIDLKVLYIPINGFVGGIISDDTIVINSMSHFPQMDKGDFMLFISFHEVRHIIQQRENKMDDLYFKPVVDKNIDEFQKNYTVLERDANKFAHESMQKLNINIPIQELSRNELFAKPVFSMMERDIDKFKAKSMYELIKIQVIGNIDVDSIRIYTEPKELPTPYKFDNSDFDDDVDVYTDDDLSIDVNDDDNDLGFSFDDDDDDDFSFSFDDDYDDAKDFSTLSKKELQELIDDALTKRDFDMIKKLSVYLEAVKYKIIN
jgi:archaellum component FlaC